jgi:hypothetical protein
MLIRQYVVRELSKEGIMIRPIATNWNEGPPGEYLFGDSYSDERYETRGDAEKAIYDFYFRMWKKEGASMYIAPRFTVIELFGFEGE